MSKPDITLEPSKGVVSEMAARIYSAYIIRGDVQEGQEDQWMQRSIREAVRIAKTVERSVATDDASVADENSRSPSGNAPSPSASEKPAEQQPAPAADEGSKARSGLEAVIEGVLADEDTSAVMKKNQ